LGTIGKDEYKSKIDEYLEDLKISSLLRSKYFLKIAHSIKAEADRLSTETIQEILFYINKSIEARNNNQKAWHHNGLINFEAVEFHSNEKSSKKVIDEYVKSSLRSLVKALSLGASDIVSSSIGFQDTLRVLTLWFKHGDNPDVAKIIEESF